MVEFGIVIVVDNGTFKILFVIISLASL